MKSMSGLRRCWWSRSYCCWSSFPCWGEKSPLDSLFEWSNKSRPLLFSARASSPRPPGPKTPKASSQHDLNPDSARRPQCGLPAAGERQLLLCSSCFLAPQSLLLRDKRPRSPLQGSETSSRSSVDLGECAHLSENRKRKTPSNGAS